MPDDDDLERRVRKLAVEQAETRWLALRLDDDVKEVREELRAIRRTQAEHGARFDSVEDTLARHGARFDSLENTLTEHGARFDSVENTLAQHGARFDSLENTMTEHGARFDSVAGQLRSLTQLVGQVLDRLPEEPAASGDGS